MNTARKEDTSPSPKGEDSLDHVVAVLRHHWFLVLLVTLAGSTLSGVWAKGQTPIYRAEATIQLDPKPPTPLGKGVDAVVELGSNSYWANREYFSTEYRVISSRRISEAVVRQLGLDRDEGFLRNQKLPAGNAGSKQVTVHAAAEELRKRLQVMPVKESRLVDLAYDDADPDRARRVLETLVEKFLSNNVENALTSTATALDWLSRQLETLREELHESEAALHAYKTDKQISSIGIDEQATILRKEVEQLSFSRTSARSEIQKARSHVAQLRQIDSDHPETIPLMSDFGASALRELHMAHLEAIRVRESLTGSGKGEQHPEVLAATSQVRSTKEALRIELDRVKKGAEADLAALEQEESGLSNLLKEREKAALDLNLMQIEYGRLKRTQVNNEKLYNLVLERSKEANLTRMLEVNNIHMVDAPITRDDPVRPRVALSAALGAALGLGLGIGLAFWRERSDLTLKTVADIENNLHLTPLGVVPRLDSPGKKTRRRQLSTVTPDFFKETTGPVAEAIRAIRTNLLFMSPDKPFKTLVTTSAGPAEGKTTVSCCLGIAMAQAGLRVLLVDADMRRPRLAELFHREDSGGGALSTGLLDPSTVLPELLGTDIPNLSMLPAGPIPPNPSELLQGANFNRLKARLSSAYDVVLFDSPPLLVTDAAILSTHVDGCILVVRADSTEIAAASRASRALVDVGGRIAGVVLNAVQRGSNGYGYGYGYGYDSKQAESPSSTVSS